MRNRCLFNTFRSVIIRLNRDDQTKKNAVAGAGIGSIFPLFTNSSNLKEIRIGVGFATKFEMGVLVTYNTDRNRGNRTRVCAPVQMCFVFILKPQAHHQVQKFHKI